MASLDAILGQAKSYASTKLNNAVPSFDSIVSRLGSGDLSSSSGSSGGTAPRSWWEAANRRSDPLLNIYWYCDLPDINGMQCPWNFVEEVVLPFVEFEQISNYRAGKNYHYPSHYNLNSLTMRLYEDSQGTAAKYTNAWRQQMLNKDTGLYSVASQYKKPVKVTVLNVAMATVLVFEYTGCWIQSEDALTLTSGNSQAIARNVTLSVDELILKFGDFRESSQVNSLIDNLGKDFPATLPRLPTSFPSVFSDVSNLLFR